MILNAHIVLNKCGENLNIRSYIWMLMLLVIPEYDRVTIEHIAYYLLFRIPSNVHIMSSLVEFYEQGGNQLFFRVCCFNVIQLFNFCWKKSLSAFNRVYVNWISVVIGTLSQSSTWIVFDNVCIALVFCFTVTCWEPYYRLTYCLNKHPLLNIKTTKKTDLQPILLITAVPRKHSFYTRTNTA